MSGLGRLSLALNLVHRRRSGGGGTSASAIRMGQNVNYLNYSGGSQVFKNIAVTNSINSTPSSTQLPDANYGSDGWPSTLPGTDTGINFNLLGVAVQEPYVLTWPVGRAPATITITNAVDTPAYDLANRKVTFTPRGPSDTAGPWTNVAYTFTSGDPNYPTFICRPVTDTGGVVSNAFKADFARFTSKKVLRVLKWVNYYGANITGMTAAQRQPVGGLKATKGEGVPFETLVAVANELGADLWWTMPWGAADDYYAWAGSYYAANANAGLKLYAEPGNEPFLGATGFSGQLTDEATAEGLTGGWPSRYAEGAVQAWTQLETSLGTDGSRLVRVASTQNGATSFLTTMLAFGTFASHVDAFTSAPYFDIGSISASLNDTSPAGVQAVFDALRSSIDTNITNAKTVHDFAIASGKNYFSYEGGQSLLSSLKSYLQLLEPDARMHDLYHYWMDQYVRQVQTDADTFICHFNITAAYPNNSTGNSQWGLTIAEGQTLDSTTPKANAVIEYFAGTRQLQPIYGAHLLPAGKPVGTAIASLTGRVNGSAVTVTGADAAKVSVDDLTANVLVMRIADASAFSAAGAIIPSIHEVDARDSTGSRDTAIDLTVTTDTIFDFTQMAAGISLSADALTATWVSGGTKAVKASNSYASGCFEVTMLKSSQFPRVGLADASVATTTGLTNTAKTCGYAGDNGSIWMNGVQVATGSTYTLSDVIGVELTGGKVYFYKNGTVQNAGGTTLDASITAPYPAVATSGRSPGYTANFGKTAFAYTYPSGLNWEPTPPAPTYAAQFDFIAGTQQVGGTSYGSLASVPGWTHTHSGSLSVLDSDGGVDTFAANVLPINGFGLHSYGAVTNYLRNSQDASLWSLSNVTAAANADTAPDGTLTADTLTTTSTTHSAYIQSLSAPTASHYTGSFFAKRGTMTDLKGGVQDSSGATLLAASSYYAQTNASTYSRIIEEFDMGASAIRLRPLWDSGVTGTMFIWQAQAILGSFGCGGPIIPTTTAIITTGACSTSFTLANGTYTATYTMDDGSTKAISQTVSAGVFTLAVADGTSTNLPRGRIKSLTVA